MHFVIGEVGIDEIVDSGIDGVECGFAVLTVVVVIVFLIRDFGVGTPAPACVTLAVACILVRLDVPGFLQVLIDFGKVFDIMLVPVIDVCRNVFAFVDGDDLCSFCCAFDVGVHVIEVVEVERF